AEVSARIMAIVARNADAFEEASIDEAYLDLSSLGDFEAAVVHARALKAGIARAEGLRWSVGLCATQPVAQIASAFQKPERATAVEPAGVQAFLDPLSVRVLPGVGPKTERLLHARGVRTVLDLRALELSRLTEWLGRWGADLHAKARGVSESPVSN